MPRSVKDGVKRTIGRAVRLVRRGASRATPAEAAPPQPFTVPPEIAALHRCQWRLPHDKAARILGYVAPVSFAEGCERSIAWLKERDRLSSRAS
jgi:hypothetical protein